jgi:hypothetical protein
MLGQNGFCRLGRNKFCRHLIITERVPLFKTLQASGML